LRPGNPGEYLDQNEIKTHETEENNLQFGKYLRVGQSSQQNEMGVTCSSNIVTCSGLRVIYRRVLDLMIGFIDTQLGTTGNTAL
jgi:hypothetical protein